MSGDSLHHPPPLTSADPVRQDPREQPQAGPAASPPHLDPKVFDALPDLQSPTVGKVLWLIETSARIASALGRFLADGSREALERELASADVGGLPERLR